MAMGPLGGGTEIKIKCTLAAKESKQRAGAIAVFCSICRSAKGALPPQSHNS